MNGIAVFVGTRVPIAFVLDSLVAGEKWDDLVEAYSFLTPDHIEAARAYVGLPNREAKAE